MITQAQIKEKLVYCNNGTFKRVMKSGRLKDAGGVNIHTGYAQIYVCQKKLQVHRMVFLYHYGYLPEIIDHIDCNPLNNRIENLRAATQSQNEHNRPLSPRNSSGVKGVCWHKNDKKWTVNIMVDGKNKNYGSFGSLEDARKVAEAKRVELHGEFCNHG